jgi:hypothetical protein
MNQRVKAQSELRGTPFESGRVVQDDTHTCKQVFVSLFESVQLVLMPFSEACK